jgi:glycosyltransferase involved in cell wall biosynthesis
VYWQSAKDEAAAEGRRPALRTRLYHGGWRLREVAASLRASDACVFSNRPDLDFAVEQLGVSRERATVVLNGIPENLQGLPLSEAGDEIGVAVIGTWAPRKGARYAAAALTALLGRRPEVRAVLLGTRVCPEDVLRDFPASVAGRVQVVPGYDRSELPQLLAGCHVLLSASLAEGFSVAIPEGMAAGLAPVVTSLPGTREIVRHEQNGLLVPPADAVALEMALDRVVGDRALLSRLRAAAHADAQGLTGRRIAERNLEIYEQVVAR